MVNFTSAARLARNRIALAFGARACSSSRLVAFYSFLIGILTSSPRFWSVVSFFAFARVLCAGLCHLLRVQMRWVLLAMLSPQACAQNLLYRIINISSVDVSFPDTWVPPGLQLTGGVPLYYDPTPGGGGGVNALLTSDSKNTYTVPNLDCIGNTTRVYIASNSWWGFSGSQTAFLDLWFTNSSNSAPDTTFTLVGGQHYRDGNSVYVSTITPPTINVIGTPFKIDRAQFDLPPSFFNGVSKFRLRDTSSDGTSRIIAFALTLHPPIACPQGYYCPLNPRGNVIACPGGMIPCPSGQYGIGQGLNTSSACAICPRGTFSSAGAANCTICLPGTFAPANGSTSCQQCMQGYFCPPNSTNATLCPRGTFSIAGASNCTPCSFGTFASEAGSTLCQKCPGGHFCPAGSSSWARLNCGLGSYCPDGSGAPTPCPYQVPPSGGWGALQVQGPAFLVETAHCLNHCFWNHTSGNNGALSRC